MSIPYRIVLAAALLAALAFSFGPSLTLRQIASAAAANDAESWPELVNGKDMQVVAGKMLAAMLDLKMYAEIKQHPREAMRDNLQAKEQVQKTALQLTQPLGLSYLVCGELTGDPSVKSDQATECWALDGRIRWESPVRVRATFTHPQTHWESSLVLVRTGLFSWQAVGIDLPIEAILDRFADSVGLKKPQAI